MSKRDVVREIVRTAAFVIVACVSAWLLAVLWGTP